MELPKTDLCNYDEDPENPDDPNNPENSDYTHIRMDGDRPYTGLE